MVAPTRAVLALQTPEVQAVAPRLALVSRATMAAAVAVGAAMALASVAAGLEGHLPLASTVLTGCPSQAATRYCTT